MGKLIIRFLLLVIAILVAILVVRDDPGQLLLRYRDYSIETTLAFAVILVVVLVVLVHFTLRILRAFLQLPGSISSSSQTRRYAKARRQLNQGLIDLAEGRFEQAENNLMRLVDFSESPLVHYLAAARAAQLQGKHEARDSYLKRAHEANPDAELAIGVTQAELQLAHLQTEQALATLTHLHGVAPKHDYVTMLLARVYFELKDWAALIELLPDVRRKKLLKPARIREMERVGYRGALEQASADQSRLESVWARVPKDLQTDAGLLSFYGDQFARRGWSSAAVEQALMKSLDQHWDDRLIEVYGRFRGSDANSQLSRLEKWLDDYGHNEQLLLALGRIALRARLWGKAQGYLEASIGARPTPAACLELAGLLEEQLKQPDEAVKYYRQGLGLSLDGPR